MPKICLNVGCDNDIRGSNQNEMWVNIDAFNINHPSVIKMSAEKLEFPDNYFDEICARDVLEHISWRKTDDVLKEWYRALKPGGTIYIQSPNIVGWSLAVIHKKASFAHCIEHIFAHQNNLGNYHFTGFCVEDITERMTKAGFKNIEHLSEDKQTKKTDEDSNVHVWGIK